MGAMSPYLFLAQGVVSLCLVYHIFIPSRSVAGVFSHLLGLSTFKPDTRSQSLLFTKYNFVFAFCFAKIFVLRVYNRLRSRYSHKEVLFTPCSKKNNKNYFQILFKSNLIWRINAIIFHPKGHDNDIVAGRPASVKILSVFRLATHCRSTETLSA